MQVLILGNGISRLQYAEEIKDWEGDLWVINYAFLEYGHRCQKITGHPDVMKQAWLWKKIHDYSYQTVREEDYRGFPGVLRGNSGIFFIAYALGMGYTDINLCGFDFGGKDVWTPDMEKRPVGPGMMWRLKELPDLFPDAYERLTFWKPKPGYDALSVSYQPVFITVAEENERLKAERDELCKRLGYSVTAPEPEPVNEDTRGEGFYNTIMRRMT